MSVKGPDRPDKVFEVGEAIEDLRYDDSSTQFDAVSFTTSKSDLKHGKSEEIVKIVESSSRSDIND